MDAAEIFRQNLYRLSAGVGYDSFDALAGALNFRNNDRKWLRRCWDNGLKQPDVRTKTQLEALAGVLRVGVEDLWNKAAEVNPYGLLNDRYHFGMLVRQILEVHRFLQQAKLRKRKKVREALAIYGYDERMFIADWVAKSYGAERPYIDFSVFTAESGLLSDADLTEQYLFGDMRIEETLDLGAYLIARGKKHPRWDDFISDMYEYYIVELGIHEEAMIDAHIRDAVVRIADEFRLRTLSHEDIYKLFESFYLDENDVKRRNEDYDFILNVLKLHPMWPAHVVEAFDGDSKKAEDCIMGMWSEAIHRTSEDTLIPEDFIGYYRRRLDDLLISEYEADQIARSRRTKLKSNDE